MGRGKCPSLTNVGAGANVHRISPFDGWGGTNEPTNVQTAGYTNKQTVPQTDRRTGRETDMQYADRQTN